MFANTKPTRTILSDRSSVVIIDLNYNRYTNLDQDRYLATKWNDRAFLFQT